MIEPRPIRGFLFACTQKSEAECLNGLVFGTDRPYAPVVIRVRKGDVVFLNNVDTDALFGVFEAVTDGQLNVREEAFSGRYPHQVRVEPVGETRVLNGAKRYLQKFEVTRNTPLFGRKLVRFLGGFIEDRGEVSVGADSGRQETARLLSTLMDNIQRSSSDVDIPAEIPLIEATTFWDFPRQSYGLSPKGNNKYAGVTPALIIYNMLWRYTDIGDLVVDPMCGSGTTIDVCKEEKRRAIGYDISPAHPDVIQNDARSIPLDDASVDMVFIDSPYGDNIKYNDNPGNIGNISSESEAFYDELEKVMRECARILKDGKVLGWLIGDQWVGGEFTPVGFRIYERLCKYFRPMDVVCVSRKGQSSNTGIWHNRARRFGFYLRGFKYLIIVRKTVEENRVQKRRRIKWASYDRNRTDRP